MSQTLHIVRASAGSGKTYQLAANYIAKAIDSPNPRTAFRSILAVTFTNKATAEMKSRIIEFLGDLSRGENSSFCSTIQQLTGMSEEVIRRNSSEALYGVLTDYSAFSISTIDAFFQRIVRSFFFELGLDIQYEVVLERQDALIEAIDEIVERSATDVLLDKKIRRLVNSKIEQGQRVDLRKEFTSLFDNAARSGALGSNSIQASDAEDRFNEYAKVAKSAKHRFVEICECAVAQILSRGISVADFKNGSRSFAAYFFKVQISSQVEPLSKAILSIAEQGSKAEDFIKKNGANNDIVIELFEGLKGKARELVELNLLIKTFDAVNETFARYALLSTLQEQINLIMNSRGELAIDSTPQLLDRLTQEASVPFIFEKLGTKFDTIFIDEFQDTSRAQWVAFLPLLEEAVSKAEQLSVMLIGDVKQAIYRWRGGDWTLLDSGVQSDMGRDIIKFVSLSTSWRSEAVIVEFNNSVFREVVAAANNKIEAFVANSSNHSRLTKQLNGAYSCFEQSVAPTKVEPRRGYVELTRFEQSVALEWMVTTVREQLSYRSASQVAILVRDKKHGALVSEALTNAGIEFISDDVLTLGSSLVVSFVINILRYTNGVDAVVLAAINRFLGRSLSQEMPLEDIAFIESICGDELLSIIERIVGYYELGTRDILYLQALYSAAHDFSQKEPFHSIDLFVELWDMKLSGSTVTLGENSNAVRILTIHKSKGLEFETVIVPFTQWKLLPSGNDNYMWKEDNSGGYLSGFGLYPIKYKKELVASIFAEDYYAEGVASIVDNVNLLYVALTRASVELYIGLGDKISSTQVGSVLDVAITDKSNIVSYGEKCVEQVELSKDAPLLQSIKLSSLESFELPPFYIEEKSN